MPHLMDEHGGASRGGYDCRAGARVAAEGKAPAVGRRDRNAECMRAVQYRKALQPRQVELCLEGLHCLPRSTLCLLFESVEKASRPKSL